MIFTDSEIGVNHIEGAEWTVATPGTGGIALPAGSRHVRFDYTALHFASPERTRFEVWLEGVDGGWTDAGALRRVAYHDLEPGQYTFHVRAANGDGVWNEQGASLAFAILPHFWETPWFRAARAFSLVLIGAVVTGAAMRVIAARTRDRQEINRQRSELAHLSRVTMLGEPSGSLAHELNQPLTAILSNAQAAQRFLARPEAELGEVRDILSDIVEQDRRAGEIIHRLRVLLRKGEIERGPVDVAQVVRETLKLVGNDLINRSVVCDINLAADLPTALGDRVQLQQVLLNLILNACEAVEAYRLRGGGCGLQW